MEQSAKSAFKQCLKNTFSSVCGRHLEIFKIIKEADRRHEWHVGVQFSLKLNRSWVSNTIFGF